MLLNSKRTYVCASCYQDLTIKRRRVGKKNNLNSPLAHKIGEYYKGYRGRPF
jgi:hypothetical protein